LASTNEDEFSDKVWPVHGELLRDEAADRKSESVEFLNASASMKAVPAAPFLQSNSELHR